MRSHYLKPLIGFVFFVIIFTVIIRILSNPANVQTIRSFAAGNQVKQKTWRDYGSPQLRNAIRNEMIWTENKRNFKIGLENAKNVLSRYPPGTPLTYQDSVILGQAQWGVEKYVDNKLHPTKLSAQEHQQADEIIDKINDLLWQDSD